MWSSGVRPRVRRSRSYRVGDKPVDPDRFADRYGQPGPAVVFGRRRCGGGGDAGQGVGERRAGSAQAGGADQDPDSQAGSGQDDQRQGHAAFLFGYPYSFEFLERLFALHPLSS